MPEHPFLGPTYANTFLEADQQRCVNWFVKGNTLMSKPGYQLWTTAGLGPIRGWAKHQNELITASKNGVYSTNLGGATKQVGSLDTGIGTVYMASSGWDGGQTLITDGKFGYYYAGGTVTRITDAQFPSKPQHCVFDNGFFLVLKGNTGEFHKSENAFDVVSWGGEFATAEHIPDQLKAIIVSRNDLWLVGESSVESWFYSGRAFPWDPNRQAVQNYGIIAPNSLTRFDNNIAWLAKSEDLGLVAVRTNQFQVTPLDANGVIEKEWSEYETVEDAIGWSFQYPGLGQFLVFQFPTADKTWVFDAKEKMWHEWEQWDADPLAVGRHAGDRHIFFSDRHLISDNYDGSVYEMDHQLYQNAGKTIVRKRMGPNLHGSRSIVTFVELDLVMRMGVGKSGDPEPVVKMSYSDDRGATWSNWQTTSIGGVGARTKTAMFDRMGSAKERVFQLEVSHDVNAMLTDSDLTVEREVA